MQTLLPETLSIDKRNWTPVKFGDVVFEPKESSKDPHADGIEYVVGLEHIESEDIHLRNSATLEEATSFTKRFSKDDVLFGRRRAYLKKAAQASFDGICSGDITVMRTKEELREDLLPFVVQNEKFFDYAVKHSAGGLSPRVKFKDLANYEFLLPPKDQQAQLAKLLWAMDEVIEKNHKTLLATNNYFESNRNEIFSNVVNKNPLCVKKDSDFQLKKFGHFYKTKSMNGIYKSKEFQGSGIRIINMGELFAYHIIRDEKMSLIELTSKEMNQYLVKEGDLIFARRSLVIEGAGKCAIIGKHETPMTFESSMIRVRLDEKRIIPKFVYHYLKSNQGRKQIRRIIGFTTVAGITSTDLALIKIPKTSIYKQEQILDFLNQFEEIFKAIKVNISNSKALQKSLINQVF